jgi:hydrogenase nickel incorporation protein HypA/HybF
MHEWALAEAIVASVSEIAEKEGLKEVKKVRVRVGELQQVERDVLKFAFCQLKSGKLRDALFNIRAEKARLKCRACGNQWGFNKRKLDEYASEAIHFVPEVAHTYIKCPKCGSPDFEIVRGRGVVIESIEGVK